MSKNIPLSPKYGVNPTIPICFMCGKPKNEIALLGRIGDGRKGEDFEAPKYTLLDYEPCDECRKNMSLGVTILEGSTVPVHKNQPPIQNGIYPTGRWCVLKCDAAKRIFGEENNHMNIFFDTEFTGLAPNTTLISIGMIAETGEKFYAEFTDFDESLVDDWQLEHIFTNCLIDHFKGYYPNCCDIKPFVWTVIGDSNYVANNLKTWLTSLYCKHCQEDGQTIQFVSDVCHYDMVLLCNLLGGAMKLPKWINPVCYDICQDICARKEKPIVGGKGGVIRWYADMDYMRDAFEISREALCTKIAGKLPEGNKHNALFDAEVIKMIFEGLREGATDA